MIHPHTELRYIGPEIGFGVVATKRIPKGTITWVLDKLGREFSPMDVEKMDPIYQEILDYYTYRNNKGNFVLCWDNGRYVNHSFRANCLTTAYDFEVAIRDIEEGEQITDDYGYLNIPRPFKGMDEGSRRKVVYPDDLLRYYQVWDRKLTGAIKYVPKREQPLRTLITSDTWERVCRIANGQEEMQSILTCYYSSVEKLPERVAWMERQNGHTGSKS
jgi:uncharacterized protein